MKVLLILFLGLMVSAIYYSEAHGAFSTSGNCSLIPGSSTLIQADCCGGGLCNMEVSCGDEVKSITCNSVESQCPSAESCISGGFVQLDTTECRSDVQVFAYTATPATGYTAKEIKDILAKRTHQYRNDANARIAALANLGHGTDRITEKLQELMEKLNEAEKFEISPDSSPEDLLRSLAEKRADYEMLRIDASLLLQKLGPETGYMRALFGARNNDISKKYTKTVNEAKAGIKAVISSARQSQKALEQGMHHVNEEIKNALSDSMKKTYENQLLNHQFEQKMVNLSLVFNSNVTKTAALEFKFGMTRNPKERRAILNDIDKQVHLSQKLLANLPAIYSALPTKKLEDNFNHVINDGRAAIADMKKVQNSAYKYYQNLSSRRQKKRQDGNVDTGNPEDYGWSLLEEEAEEEQKAEAIKKKEDADLLTDGLMKRLRIGRHTFHCFDAGGCTNDPTVEFSMLGNNASEGSIFAFNNFKLTNDNEFSKEVKDRFLVIYADGTVGDFAMTPELLSAAHGIGASAQSLKATITSKDKKIDDQKVVVDESQSQFSDIVSSLSQSTSTSLTAVEKATVALVLAAAKKSQETGVGQYNPLNTETIAWCQFILGIMTPEQANEFGADRLIDAALLVASGGAGIIVKSMMKNGYTRSMAKATIKQIVESAGKFGAKTPEAIADLAKFYKRYLGSEIGAIGNIEKFTKQLGGMRLDEAKRLLRKWDISSSVDDSLASNLRYHARDHGFGDNIGLYLRKASNFNFKGARKIGPRPDGTTRWERKNLEYIIKRGDKIVSYGFNKK